MILTKLAWVTDKRVTLRMEKLPNLSPELNMTITRLTPSLIKVWEKILKLNLDFQQNMINGKKLAMLVWNSISMEERAKDQELIWNKTSFICHHPGKHLNSQYQNLIEVFWRWTQENYPQAQEIMNLSYRQLNREYKMLPLQCQKHQETCLSPNTELCTKT